MSDIVRGRRSISTEMACLLAAALGTAPEFWVSLEATYRLKTFDRSGVAGVTPLARCE